MKQNIVIIIFVLLQQFVCAYISNDYKDSFDRTPRIGTGNYYFDFVYSPYIYDLHKSDKQMIELDEIVSNLLDLISFRPVWNIYARNLTLHPYNETGWKYYCFRENCENREDRYYIKRLLNEKCLWRLDSLAWFDYMKHATNNTELYANSCSRNTSDTCFNLILGQISTDVTFSQIEKCIYDAVTNNTEPITSLDLLAKYKNQL